jgi:hypothetical protein
MSKETIAGLTEKVPFYVSRQQTNSLLAVYIQPACSMNDKQEPSMAKDTVGPGYLLFIARTPSIFH